MFVDYLQAAIRQNVDLEAFRRSIRDALSLDEEVVTLALRSRAIKNRAFLTHHDYNRTWQNVELLRRVACETPNLLRPVALALKENRLAGDRYCVAELKDYLSCRGVHGPGWKIIANSSPRLFDLPFAMASNGASLEVIAQYTIVLQQFGAENRPPERFLRELLRLYVDNGSDRVRFKPGWCGLPAWLLRHAACEARCHEREGTLEYFLHNEFHRVVDWHCATRETLDKNQRRAGWSTVMRVAAQWHGQCLAQLHSKQMRWESALPAFDSWPYWVDPLTDYAGLWHDGYEMRHCVADRIPYCLSGQSRIFSIRCAQSTKRIATAEINLNSHRNEWFLASVKGFANAPVPSRVERHAREIARRYTNVCRAPQAIPF